MTNGKNSAKGVQKPDLDALRQYSAWKASFPPNSLELIKNAQKTTLQLISAPADADTTPVIQVEVTLPVKNASFTQDCIAPSTDEQENEDRIVQKKTPPGLAEGAQLIDATRLQQIYNTKMLLIQRLLDAQQCRET